MKIPGKYLRDNQHGLFLLLTLGFIFAIALGFGIGNQNRSFNPGGPNPKTTKETGFGSPDPLVLKPETKNISLKNGRLTLDGPPLWATPEENPDPGKMPLMESQRFYTATGSKTPVTEKFEIDIVDFTSRPETHLHVRQVDHNELGFGGGFKIAFELLQVF